LARSGGEIVPKDERSAASAIDEDKPPPWALYPWLLIAVAPLSGAIGGHYGPRWLSIPGVLVFAALYMGSLWFALREPVRLRPAVIQVVALGVVTFGLGAAFGGSMDTLYTLLTLACGAVIPWGRRALPPKIVMSLAIAAGVVTWLRGASGTEAFTVWWGSLLSGFVTAMFMRLLAAIAELRETREELARTAVSEERLRFSRDLHDLLGHTLSVMVVKAQAVRRLAPRDGERAAEQAADIESIGRDALQQVRLAVTGYRGRGLDAEIDGARTALADAGIEAVIRRDTPVAASPETDALLGWAVREGVTNVIRHSGARRCEIAIDRNGSEVLLKIVDNGSDAPPGFAPGNGLRGLTERMTGSGGTIETSTAEGGGFRLTVTLPV
jgi:two-component system, NarL family, sensor histidine kinase DesK